MTEARRGPKSAAGLPPNPSERVTSVYNRNTAQSVNWWTVHRFVQTVLDQVDGWPMAGTPAWCSLTHDDPTKWAALLDSAQHWALRIEMNQEARAEASKDISAAADWKAIAQELSQLQAFRAANPWAKRDAS